MKRLVGLLTVVVLAGTAAGIAFARNDRPGALGLVRVASGFERPVFVTAPRSEPGRLYVVEQGGVVRVLVGGRLRARPFLDIHARVNSAGERAGAARAGVRSRLREEPPLLRGLHGEERRHVRCLVPLGRDGRNPLQRASAAPCPAAVREPQRRHGRVRARRQALRRHGRRRLRRRPREPRSESERAAREAPSGRRTGKSAPTLRRSGSATRGASRSTGRPATSTSATSARTRSRRSTSSRRDRVSLNFGWRRLRGAVGIPARPLGPGALTMPIAQYTHDDGCSVTGGYVYRGRRRARPRRGATSTATTAAGRSGA